MTVEAGIATRTTQTAALAPLAPAAQPEGIPLEQFAAALKECENDRERLNLVAMVAPKLTQRAATAAIIADCIGRGDFAAEAVRLVYTQPGDTSALPAATLSKILANTVGDEDRLAIVGALKSVVPMTVDAVAGIVKPFTNLIYAINAAREFLLVPIEANGEVKNARDVSPQFAAEVLRKVWPNEGERLAAMTAIKDAVQFTPEAPGILVAAFDKRAKRADAQRLLDGKVALNVSGTGRFAQLETAATVLFNADLCDRVTLHPAQKTLGARANVAWHNATTWPNRHPIVGALFGSSVVAAGVTAAGITVPVVAEAVGVQLPQIAATAVDVGVGVLLAGVVASLGAAIWGLFHPVKRVD